MAAVESIDSDCKLNYNPNSSPDPSSSKNPFTFTFGKRDNTSSDRTFIIYGEYLRGSGIVKEVYIKVTQTKRDKYVTKLDNAVITVDNIPASGGTVSSGKLTYRKTFNTGETENATENITFTTVSAIQKEQQNQG